MFQSGMRFALGEEIEALRDSVARFAAEQIAPRAADIDRENAFPMDLWPKMGELGLHGITVPETLGGAGMGYLAHCVAIEEISRASASVGLSYGAHSNLCINQIAQERQRGAEGALPARADRRGDGRGAGDERARRGLGRGLDGPSRGAGRERRRCRLGARRQQDVDHQRARRGHARRLRQDRPRRRCPRHHRLPGRARHGGVHDGAEARQARHARLEHLRAGVRGLSRVPAENVLGAESGAGSTC